MTTQTGDELWGHPKGLYVLFFTEMWERFSYYGMRALLTLYMVAKVTDGSDSGLGWDKAEALSIYGWYTMWVYVMAVPGGLIADRLIGQKKAVMAGGFLLCCGHGILAFDSITAFYSGLILIVLGVGMLKPNISTMVGGLYAEGDARRDKGFTIFYIGINVGAFAASIIVGYVGQKIGWHWGFGLAGIGMALGQLQFIIGQKHLRGVGDFEARQATAAVAPSKPLTPIEIDRIKVLLLSFMIVIVFWGAFEQAGGLMNIYTEQKVDRTLFGWDVPASWLQSLNPLFIMIFGTAVANYWYRRQAAGGESSALFKMSIGTMIMGLGFLFMVGASLQADSSGKAGMYWLVAAYFFHTIGELCASPVALSFVTKLAPAKYASLMMGVYFCVSGLGNKVAGLVGEYASEAGELTIFLGICAVCVLFGMGVLSFLKPLKAMTHGAEDDAEVAA